MNCPKCDGKTGVLATRHGKRNRALIRRRKCKSCGFRYTTEENPVKQKPKSATTHRALLVAEGLL